MYYYKVLSDPDNFRGLTKDGVKLQKNLTFIRKLRQVLRLGTAVTTKESDPIKLDVLTLDIQQLLQVFRRRNESQTAARLPNTAVSHIPGSDVMTHLEECLVSANIVVASASTIVDSRSTNASIEKWIPEPVILEEERENLSEWKLDKLVLTPGPDVEKPLVSRATESTLIIEKGNTLTADERKELEALSEMDSCFAAEEVGDRSYLLNSLRALVVSKYGAITRQALHPWSQIVKNIRMSPRPGIIGRGHGYSLLHAFAEFRHDAAVQLLLSKGADIDAPDQSGEAILCNAIGRFDGDFSLRLLDAGASVRSTRGHKTALHKAVELGFEHIVKILLERGSDVNDSNGWLGYTPLHVAVTAAQESSQDNENIIKILMAKGADVNARSPESDDTPLHVAAAGSRQEKILKLLLDGGADVTLKNHKKKTPLAIATRISFRTSSIAAVVQLLQSTQAERKWIF